MSVEKRILDALEKLKGGFRIQKGEVEVSVLEMKT